MIRYALVCDEAHAFEGWFARSADFDAQAAGGLVECPVCGSHSVTKQIMAPAVAGAKKRGESEAGAPEGRRQMMMEAMAHVRRSELRAVKWLFADMNVAPQYTLDAVESLATSRRVQIRGLLLTLKLLEWDLAEQVPTWLTRIRSWGFPYVRARQLQQNRQEICVVALKRKPKPRAQAGGRRKPPGSVV